MIDHYDEMRVAPDPSLAEELRKRLHARIASVQRDEHEDRSELQPDAGGVEPDQQLIAVTEIYVAPDSSSTETRYRRRLAMAVAAVVAFVGVAAIVINSLNSDDAEAPSPAVTPTLAQTTAAAPSTLAISTTTEPVGVPGALPDGTYRVEITRADLEAVNARDFVLAGTWEWTFRGGDWSYQNTSTSALIESTFAGTYVVDGDHIEFFVPGYLWGAQQRNLAFTWQANRDGSLQFTYLPSTQANWAALLGSHPLVPTT